MALKSSSPFGRVDATSKKSIAQVKGLFFDKARVMKSADAASIKVLSKFGAFVRAAAQRSMRFRKGASAPGQPPSAHGVSRKSAKAAGSKYRGAWLRELLFFSYDPVTKTCVVGPLGFKSSDVPGLMEFGGTRVVTNRTWYEKAAGGRNARRRGDTKRTFSGSVRYPARPFMRPALEKVLPDFAPLFQNSIGG